MVLLGGGLRGLLCWVGRVGLGEGCSGGRHRLSLLYGPMEIPPEPAGLDLAVAVELVRGLQAVRHIVSYGLPLWPRPLHTLSWPGKRRKDKDGQNQAFSCHPN